MLGMDRIVFDQESRGCCKEDLSAVSRANEDLSSGDRHTEYRVKKMYSTTYAPPLEFTLTAFPHGIQCLHSERSAAHVSAYPTFSLPIGRQYLPS